MADKIEITVRVEVDPSDFADWQTTVTGGEQAYADLFSTNYCGYWLRGLEHRPDIGWLAWEMDESLSEAEAEALAALYMRRFRTIGALSTTAAVREAWAKDSMYVLDEETAKRAWGCGIERHGASWYTDGDVNTYDAMLQLALLGEIRYG